MLTKKILRRKVTSANHRAKKLGLRHDLRTNQVWNKLIDQGKLCIYCGAPLVFDGRAIHLAHIKLLAYGGESTIENIAFSCSKCNLKDAQKIRGPYLRQAISPDLPAHCLPRSAWVDLLPYPPILKEWFAEKANLNYPKEFNKTELYKNIFKIIQD